jgi:uncharacterized SAM-binding protein YcdF (DUF218 family)
MPLPFCLGLVLLGLWFLLRSRRTRPRLGRWMVLWGLGLLLFFSQSRVGTWLLRPLEQTYPVIPEFAPGQPLPPALERVRYILVLGGGHKDEDNFPAAARLSPSALSRLTEGVRLWRALPDRRLIVSGPNNGNPANPAHADVLAAAAISMGVSADRIVRIDTARDTEEEAEAVKKLIANAPAAVVTSAWHLPRAAALFRGAGVDIIPCPADFLALRNQDFQWTDLAFDVDGLQRSTWAIRERIGYLGVACGERSDRRNAQSTGQRTRPHAVGQETQGLGNCMHLSGAAACPILGAMRPGSWVLRPPVTTGRPNVTFR